MAYTESPLQGAADSYLKRGWLVLPAIGKKAAISWMHLPRPDEQQLVKWFSITGVDSIAILTGRRSQLLVMDFDTTEAVERYEAAFPALCNTYTVQTRRGLHLYYRVTHHPLMVSAQGMGVDMQYDGRYVIAPPSPGYTVVVDVPPLAIGFDEYAAIYAWLRGGATPAATQPPTPPPPAPNMANEWPTDDQLRQMWRASVAASGSRNRAAFIVGCWCRDIGMDAPTVLAAIEREFTGAARDGERPEQRRRELVATLKSVYSRPPRANKRGKQLPDQIRLALHASGQMAVWRVLDGLAAAGYQPGAVMTEREMCEALKGRVGRPSIRAALVATYGGQALFPPRPPFSPTNVAPNTSHPEIDNCIVVGCQKVTKVPHRPARHFEVPSHGQVAAWIGYAGKWRKAATSVTKQRGAAPRMSVLLGKIQRKPGRYANAALATWMGVSVRTLQRYKAKLRADGKLHSVPQFDAQQLTPRMAAELPAAATGGKFLRDKAGKRYPATAEVAASLLQRHPVVMVYRQRPNWYGTSKPKVQAQAKTAKAPEQKTLPAMPPSARPEPTPEVIVVHTSGTIKQRPLRVATWARWRDLSDSERVGLLREECKARGWTRLEATLETAWKYTGMSELTPKRVLQAAQEMDERMKMRPRTIKAAANRAKRQQATKMAADVERIQTMLKDPVTQATSISATTIDRLAQRYGFDQVRAAAQLVASRRNVGNPAGLLTVILSSNATVGVRL